MFKFLRRDPVEKAKKHIDKALEELEEGYPDYASIEYEKAAEKFLEAGHVQFAVKYYREAAYAALEDDDHVRAAEMKMHAARLMINDALFSDGGALFAEASDHLNRERKMRESLDALATAVLCYLAARMFDTAINLSRKMEQRRASRSGHKTSLFKLAEMCVGVLCEGHDIRTDVLDKTVAAVKTDDSVRDLIEFVTASVRYAMETEVAVEWAGPSQELVTVKTPLEFELRYRCPVPVRVVDYRLPLSNSLAFVREPDIGGEVSTTGSWLMEITPVLSGEAVVGPIRLTLEGDRVLVHKQSNVIRFEISPAPPDVQMAISPKRISCEIGDEVVLDVDIRNRGDGPANNLVLSIEPSDELEISLGGREKTIQFIGTGETMRFQIYLRGVALGTGIVTLRLSSPDESFPEIVESAEIRVGAAE